MEVVYLLVNPLVAGVVSLGVAFLAPDWVAERGELGRQRQSDRKELVQRIQGLSAKLREQRAAAVFQSSMGHDYLSADMQEQFAEDIVRHIGLLRQRQRNRMLSSLRRLVGAVTTQMALDLAHAPAHQRHPQWRAAYFYHQTGQPEKQGINVKDRGLLGQAKAAPFIGQYLDQALDELTVMERNARRSF